MLTTKIYNKPTASNILSYKNQNLDQKARTDPENASVKTKEHRTTKKLATRSIHVNNIYENINDTGEGRMC